MTTEHGDRAALPEEPSAERKIAAFRFALLDPRPDADNEGIFANPLGVLGVEVTDPTLAARCTLGNIDPQHGDTPPGAPAAIEEALTAPLPPEGAMIVTELMDTDAPEFSGATLATIRPDLDAFGAMAVLHMRMRGGTISPAVRDRIMQIADADRFAHGEWPGPQEFPPREQPDEPTGGTRDLAAIAAMVSDHRVSVEDRVSAVARWLLTGEEPAEYRERVEHERADLAGAIARGEIPVHLEAAGRIAVVTSTYRAATTIGYAHAPIVIAVNPEFRIGDGATFRKLTIAQYVPGRYVDLPAVLEELRQREFGWGGQVHAIIGSPQGRDSALSTDEVVAIVARHLRT